MRRFTSLLAICLLLGSSALLADEPRYINGTVTNVRDGDTIEVTDDDGRVWPIRLFGIDTPEHKREGRWDEQPHAQRAHKFTEGLIADAVVTVRFKMTIQNGQLVPDKTYQRYVGEVFSNGRSMNRELVRAGHAWWYESYAKGDLDLKRLQDSAKKAKRGLWKHDNPAPPWVWRRN